MNNNGFKDVENVVSFEDDGSENVSNTVNTTSNENSSPSVTIDTNKVKEIDKSGSGKLGIFLSIFVVCLIFVCIWYIDDILNFLTNNEFNIVDTNIVSNSNLVNGYIKIDDKENYMINNYIKLYGFKKSGNNIIFNYTSTKNVNNIVDKKIYIEIYNSNEELLDVALFNGESIERDMIYSYTISVDSYIYKNAYYAKVINLDNTYNKTLTCTNKVENEIYSYNKTIKYNFELFRLKSYDVSESIDYKYESNEVNSILNDISLEKKELDKNNISNKYYDSNIEYSIDLGSVNEEYEPLYNLDKNYSTIKILEEDKKWTCE